MGAAVSGVDVGAVVFDLDGTLVDSEPVSWAAMVEVLAEDGHVATDDDLHAVLGRAWPHTRAYLADLMGYDEADLAAYRQRWQAAFMRRITEIRVFEDTADLLADVLARGLPVAVCTSSGRGHLERVLDAVGLSDVFAATVAREDTDEHKPLPAPYLLTSSRLGVAGARTVAFEDSPAGVAAARSAGMTVVGVDRGMGLDLADAHVVVDRVHAGLVSIST
jgi:HAD superfamily hydrolase (TIGR01509 family)